MTQSKSQLVFWILTLITVTTAASADGVRWDGVFLQSISSNELSLRNGAANPGSVAITSGGNVENYPSSQGQVPTATFVDGTQTRAIQLRQSLVGSIAAPVSSEILVQRARELLVSAVGYATLTDETADTVRTNSGSWNIRFAGVLNPVDGTTYSDSNFFSDQTHEAAEYYRSALQVDPGNITAANGLLRTYIERIAAFTFAGHNGNERGARERLVSGDIQAETSVLETNALHFYTLATDELAQLTSRAVEAQLFDGSYPYLSVNSVAENRDRLAETFSRALSHQAETVLRIGRLKQFRDYRNPLLDEGAIAASGMLVNELKSRRNDILDRQLLLELVPEPTVVTRTEVARCRSMLGQIQALESSIENGRIAFVATYNRGAPSNPDIQFVFREYSPDYVPFHAILNDKLSHQQFLEIASDFLASAREREQASDILIRDYDVNEDAWRRSLNTLTNQYFKELGTLCGFIRGTNGQLIPDVVLALYPRTNRVQLYPYSGSGESLGEIGTQWTRIEQAQGEAKAARQDLQSIYSQLAKKKEVATEIAAGLDNLASVLLENGQKLEGLDREAGRLQSQAAIDIAQAQESSSWLSGLTKGLTVVAGAAMTVATGGAAAPTLGAVLSSANFWGAAAGQGIVGAASAWESNNKNMDAAQIQARLQQNLAEIQAQRTRIATLEKLAVQHQQKDQFLLQTDEALHLLLLQAERQKLAILMADQRIGSELLALQNLVGRVQYLLQEFANAVALENQNPLRSPDYRLVRDIRLREAEDAFLIAQRWAYLAAKSVEYRLNTSSAAERVLIQNLVAGTLRARNADTLAGEIADLNDQLQAFYIGQNREVSGIEPDYLSIRNHIVQRNRLNRTNDLDIAVAEPQPGGSSSASDWLAFLQSKLIRNSDGTSDRLLLSFGTSLEQWPTSDSKGQNPLYRTTSYNELIGSVQSFGQIHRGIEIQIIGRALPIGNSPAVFRLQYLGASAVRQEQCNGEGGRTISLWNIRRPDGQPYTTDGSLGINTWINSGTSGFDEFSPANDHWSLEIRKNDRSGNAILLENLDKIEDIRIRFWTRYFPSSSDCE